VFNITGIHVFTLQVICTVATLNLTTGVAKDTFELPLAGLLACTCIYCECKDPPVGGETMK
jgi:hypothetical protein